MRFVSQLMILIVLRMKDWKSLIMIALLAAVTLAAGFERLHPCESMFLK